MKSAHRHELETNALAHRLEVFIDRYRPYASMIAGVLIAVVVVIFIWSYWSGSSAAKRSEAWDSFNNAVAARPTNLEEIHRTAQEYPGTPLQYMADVTWADSQVFIASRSYLSNRQAAMDMLEKASSAYQGVIQTSKDENLTGRARLGLARIYEMRNQLDKAREMYGQVTGPFAKFATIQAERLAKPETQETYEWLANAKPPLPKAPVGPGTPGQQPEFSAGEIALPGAVRPDAGTTQDTKGAAEAFDNLLKSLKDDSKNAETPDRYKDDQKPTEGTAPPDKGSPTSETKDSAPPADAGKTESKPAENPPAPAEPAPPVEEKSAK